MISHEDPVEDSRQREIVEHNNQQQMKHIYPTRITLISQELNQVESAATTATIHQHRLMNIHEQVKSTSQVIDNCLKENLSRLLITITQHDYLTRTANAIINDDTGK